MEKRDLGEMVKGWFVGNFEPSAHRTEAVEVAVKSYALGEKESRHHHKIAREITVIIDGSVAMNGKKYAAGDIIILEPGESSDFSALENARTVVVKIPGVRNDKYLDGEGEC